MNSKRKRRRTIQIQRGPGWIYLAVRRDVPSPAQEKKGAVARPLDGGVLTRWGARAPARGPATVPWQPRSTARSLAASLGRRRSLAASLGSRVAAAERAMKRERRRE